MRGSEPENSSRQKGEKNSGETGYASPLLFKKRFALWNDGEDGVLLLIRSNGIFQLSEHLLPILGRSPRMRTRDAVMEPVVGEARGLQKLQKPMLFPQVFHFVRRDKLPREDVLIQRRSAVEKEREVDDPVRVGRG